MAIDLQYKFSRQKIGICLSCLACLEKVLHLGKPQERTFRKPSGNKGVREPLVQAMGRKPPRGCIR